MTCTVCLMFASVVPQFCVPSLLPLCSYGFCDPGAACRSTMTPNSYFLRTQINKKMVGEAVWLRKEMLSLARCSINGNMKKQMILRTLPSQMRYPGLGVNLRRKEEEGLGHWKSTIQLGFAPHSVR
jgi:hypothetical protein